MGFEFVTLGLLWKREDAWFMVLGIQTTEQDAKDLSPSIPGPDSHRGIWGERDKQVQGRAA